MQRDALYLALTRSALKWGVPFEVLMLNVLLSFSAGVFLQAPTIWRSPIMFWLMGVPIHFALRELTGWDYHWFRTMKLEALSLRVAALTVLPTSLPRRFQDIPSSV